MYVYICEEKNHQYSGEERIVSERESFVYMGTELVRSSGI